MWFFGQTQEHELLGEHRYSLSNCRTVHTASRTILELADWSQASCTEHKWTVGRIFAIYSPNLIDSKHKVAEKEARGKRSRSLEFERFKVGTVFGQAVSALSCRCELTWKRQDSAVIKTALSDTDNVQARWLAFRTVQTGRLRMGARANRRFELPTARFLYSLATFLKLFSYDFLCISTSCWQVN